MVREMHREQLGSRLRGRQEEKPWVGEIGGIYALGVRGLMVVHLGFRLGMVTLAFLKSVP